MLYLDHNATTPCDPRVIDAMLPFFGDQFWNPGSAHVGGRRARQVVEDARRRFAGRLGVEPDSVVFTSGSTESIQIALERLPEGLKTQLPFFSSDIEHRAVRNALARLATGGADVRTLTLTPDGSVDVDRIREPGVYVVQAANSETGIRQPLGPIAAGVREAGGLLVVDAAQALWKTDFADWAGVADALVLSAHKAYGPKGIGTLVLSEEMRRLLKAHGLEAQEAGIREGTLNVPLIVGFAAALELAATEGEAWRRAARAALDAFEAALVEADVGLDPLFRDRDRLPNTSAVRVRGVPGDAIVAQSTEVAISFGTACSSGAPGPSPALVAFGLSSEDALQTVRVSFGREHSAEDGKTAARYLVAVAERLQS